MILIYFSFIFFYIADIQNCLATNNALKVFYLNPGDIIHYEPELRRQGFYESDIRIYCYKSNQKSITNYFQTINFQIEIENADDYVQYDGETPEIVKERYEEQKSIFSFNFLTFKKTKLKLDPFKQSCVGLDTLQKYAIRLNRIRVDIWNFITFCIAIIVFSYAAKLSKNALFYYLAGVSLGICASFLILLYLAGKLFPRRSMMIGFFAGGSTLAFYVFHLLWENIQLILISYKDYVMAYVIVTGFISFVLCYRFGPPKNKRSKDLIEWCLQMISLISIYFSSHYTEASIAIISLLIIIYYFPRKWIKILQCYYRRFFPPFRRYLTLEEFKEQGIVETKKALDELRKYCNSPECKQWKVMTKLKEPKRFASFIEGEQHLMDEEIFDHDHETSKNDTESEDDENDVIKNSKISDDEYNDDKDISDDEEYNSSKIYYRRDPALQNLRSNTSRNFSHNRINLSNSYGSPNTSNNHFFSRNSPYSERIISPTNIRESPYNMRRITPNTSLINPNNSKLYYRSFREYSDEES